MRALLPPILVTLLLVAMAVATFAVPWPSLMWWLRLVGLLPLIGGSTLSLHHAKLFNSLKTNIMTFDDPDMLVRSGAFAWTRNPMYLGMVLILTGAALLMGAAVALVGPLVFAVTANQWYIPFEEERMSATFGHEYDAYQGQVRRWVGRRGVGRRGLVGAGW